MKFVLDASVGLKTVLPETGSDKAEALIGEFQQQIHELIAPDTYLVECAHALTRAHRKGILQPVIKSRLRQEDCFSSSRKTGEVANARKRLGFMSYGKLRESRCGPLRR